MSQMYLVNPDGSTHPMDRVQCKSEDAELQTLLEKNHDLLPGDQIDPEAPRRWLLIKREMPVPDPSSGTNRWNIDFLFADQDAIPTFVECKRFKDTRARREVIGQMLEYVANGQFYWTKEEMQAYADTSAGNRSQTLASAVGTLQATLQPEDRLDSSEFFAKVEKNLREAQIRMVFFLEQSSMELRSLVDFLNRQLQRTEVLLVEAKQFALNSTVVVSPTLFGYTEQARQVKQSARVDTTPRVREKWDKASFDSALSSTLSADQAATVRKLIDFVTASGFRTKYGTGQDGTLSIYHPTKASTSSFMGVYTSGKLWLGFSNLQHSEEAQELRDLIKESVTNRLDLAIPVDYEKRWPTYSITEWGPRVDDLLQILREINLAPKK